MDRYQRVEKTHRSEEPIAQNEIRITTLGRMTNYITYATSLLQDKTTSEIVLKAMGRAINKSVTIAEIIKRRVEGLHQITTIGSTDIVDVWEPLEEGLHPLEQVRHVSMISITLSLKELDKTSPGYQPPLAPELVKPLNASEYDDDGGIDENANESYINTGHDVGRGRGGKDSASEDMNGRRHQADSATVRSARVRGESGVKEDIDQTAHSESRYSGRGAGQGRNRGRSGGRGRGSGREKNIHQSAATFSS
ncbi:hypothetical protein KP509_1Z121900 [Ceratopteris richardii]|nr:hypothetical protein KP509_1Z121900 [Ceratopteris richardii]